MIGEAVPEIPTLPAPTILEAPPPDSVVCPVCPMCPVPEPVKETVCPAVAVRDPVECPVCPPVPAPLICPEPAPAPIQVNAPQFRFPHLDIIIAPDVTNSMRGQVASLKAEVEQLAVLMNRISPSFGIGMVAFGDRRWESPLFLFPLRELSGPTANREAFRTFVNGLSVGMGTGNGNNPDQAEAFYDALATASRLSWQPRSERRVVVLVTDNPAYTEEIDRSIQVATGIGRSEGHRVSTVYVRTGGTDPDTEEFLRSVADAGAGRLTLTLELRDYPQELVEGGVRTMEDVADRFQRSMDELVQKGARKGEAGLLRRQIARRFGGETAGQLSKLLNGLASPDRIDKVHDALCECGTGEEFIERVRTA